MSAEGHYFADHKFSDEYETFIERFNRLYEGYKLDENMLIRTDTARTVNLLELKSILLGPHLQQGDETPRSLDGNDINGHRVALCTYPRTGNTMLREYLEEVTGVSTGSDMTTDLTLPA
jgi:hypothetical protein